MVPAQFVLLKQFPRTLNGKLDTQRRPAPDTDPSPDRTVTLPRTETERRLAEIWKEVLSATLLGVEDNFFDIGGDSLSATRVFARVIVTFEREISLPDLFEHPTISQLAKLLGERAPRSCALQSIPRLPR